MGRCCVYIRVCAVRAYEWQYRGLKRSPRNFWSFCAPIARSFVEEFRLGTPSFSLASARIVQNVARWDVVLGRFCWLHRHQRWSKSQWETASALLYAVYPHGQRRTGNTSPRLELYDIFPVWIVHGNVGALSLSLSDSYSVKAPCASS